MNIAVLLLALTFGDEPGRGRGDGQGSVPPPPVPSNGVAPTGQQQLSAKSNGGLSGQTPPPPEIAPRNSFLLQFDRDRDGRLSPAEVPEDLRRHFAKADRNGDGFLDADEILKARNPIGQRARKAENLKLGMQGKLREKKSPGGKSSIDLSAVAGEWLRRMDLNGDGVVDDQEMRAILENPELLLKDLANSRIAIPVPGAANGSKSIPPPPMPAPRTPPPDPIPNGTPTVAVPKESGRGGVAPDPNNQPDEVGPDGLPTVNTILKHLDKNHNDCVDRDEAVDQLRDHFNFLDKNKDGKLDRTELERSLKLARMFGDRKSVV